MTDLSEEDLSSFWSCLKLRFYQGIVLPMTGAVQTGTRKLLICDAVEGGGMLSLGVKRGDSGISSVLPLTSAMFTK